MTKQSTSASLPARPKGAALCYRTICTEGAALLGAAHAHPEVSMHTPSLAEYMERIYRGDWEGVGAMMLDSARKLEGMGCDFLICPDNTLHQALPYVVPRSPLPWLHIAEVVAAEAKARGYRRVGLTGTRWLMEGPVYAKELMRPDPPSARRSTASSWTSWCAACSSRKRSSTFNRSWKK